MMTSRRKVSARKQEINELLEGLRECGTVGRRLIVCRFVYRETQSLSVERLKGLCDRSAKESKVCEKEANLKNSLKSWWEYGRERGRSCKVVQ